MVAAASLKTCMPPVGASDARLLILGSLPGDASLAASRYYAHPTNQFWRLLGGAIGEELAALDYPARLERLEARGIALWDVVAGATRDGSLDGAIRAARANPLAEFVRTHPRLEAIGFNGKTAAAIGRRSLGPADGITLLDLPSSSAALTRPFAEKLLAWGALADFAAPADFRHSEPMIEQHTDEADEAPAMSMVDEALVAGNIANTNGLLVILAKLVARGIFDKDDLKAFSDSYSKPLDHEGMRENELVSQMQDQMESTLAELMRFIAEQDR